MNINSLLEMLQIFLLVSHFLLLLGYIEVFISYRAKYQYHFFHLWLLKKEVLFHPKICLALHMLSSF